MKYEKPIVREMGVPLAAGHCASGTVPDQECRGGFSNVGPCAIGTTAGEGCTTGGNPAAFPGCNNGFGASLCSTGSIAGIN